jgi:hypothetical protein
MLANYNRGLTDTTVDNSEDSTADKTREDSELIEEHKKMEGESINEAQRMTTKEKVAKLKEDLLKRKAVLRGEITEEVQEL